MVTLAPGITAPLESVTAPAIVPVYDCALRDDAHTDSHAPRNRPRLTSMVSSGGRIIVLTPREGTNVEGLPGLPHARQRGRAGGRGDHGRGVLGCRGLAEQGRRDADPGRARRTARLRGAARRSD